MKKNYVTVGVTVLMLNENDIVTASVPDGVNVQWKDAWNEGEWSED